MMKFLVALFRRRLHEGLVDRAEGGQRFGLVVELADRLGCGQFGALGGQDLLEDVPSGACRRGCAVVVRVG